MEKMKVLGIGEVVLDKINVLSGFPKDGEKIQTKRSLCSIGGPTPTSLILLSRLGVDCTFICSIANDEAGKIIKKKLKKENVNLIIQKQKRTKTNTVIINSQTGSRTIIRDNFFHKPLENIPFKLINSSSLIFLDRHEPKAFAEIVSKKSPRTKIIIDPSTEVSPKTLQMIKDADYPIIPMETLEKVDPNKDLLTNLKLICQLAQKPIIITAGEKGSFVYDGKKTKFFPAYQIKVADTLGAGDIFRGAFSYAVLKKWSLSKSCLFANRVAALQCSKIGNGTAIPTKQEIVRFKKIAKLKNNAFNFESI